MHANSFNPQLLDTGGGVVGEMFSKKVGKSICLESVTTPAEMPSPAKAVL